MYLHVHVYSMCSTIATFTAESLGCCLQNLVRMKYSCFLEVFIFFRADGNADKLKAYKKCSPFLQSSSNWMLSIDSKACRKKSCWFLFHFEVRFFTSMSFRTWLVLYFLKQFLWFYAIMASVCISVVYWTNTMFIFKVGMQKRNFWLTFSCSEKKLESKHICYLVLTCMIYIFFVSPINYFVLCFSYC